MTSTRRFTELASRLNGGVVTPANAGYDTARQVFYANHNPRPSAIVRVANAGDVSTVLEFTAEAGIDVSMRSGGHGLAGSGVIDDASRGLSPPFESLIHSHKERLATVAKALVRLAVPPVGSQPRVAGLKGSCLLLYPPVGCVGARHC